MSQKDVTVLICMMMVLCNSVVLKKSGMFLELLFPSNSTTISILCFSLLTEFLE